MAILQELLSITELAKLRHVTTETLRHYDRIGLLKPVKLDPITKQRFYSIYQYEQLGTIKELKQLGLSLKEIKTYFENRDPKLTKELLTKYLVKVQQQQAKLASIQTAIEEKLSFLAKVPDPIHLTGSIEQKVFEHDRYYLISTHPITNKVDLSYAALDLENIVTAKENSYAPIFATTRYLGLHDATGKIYLGLQIESGLKVAGRLKIPAGTYLTLQYHGSFWEAHSHIMRLKNYAKNHHLALSNTVLQTQLMDITFTNSELIYELQIKVN